MKLETILNAYGEAMKRDGFLDGETPTGFMIPSRYTRQAEKFKERLLKYIRVHDYLGTVVSNCKVTVHNGTIEECGGFHYSHVAYISACECEYPLLSDQHTMPICKMCGKQIVGSFDKTSKGE